MTGSKRLWQGALVLVTAGVINRFLGFIYRILVVRLVGAEGLGLYEMIFPLFAFMLVITTAGIPVAVAKMVAELQALGQWHRVRLVFRTAVVLMIGAGIGITLLLLVFADKIPARIFPDERAYWPFIATVPAIALIAAGSALRGFFQGLHNMIPTAVSQVCEQLVRIVCGLFLASRMLVYGPELAAVGLALGMVAGEVMGLTVLWLIYIRHRKTLFGPTGAAMPLSVRWELPETKLLKEMRQLAVPVTLTRMVTTFFLGAQALMIPRRLQSLGLSAREATTAYGQYTGVAMSLLNLPTVISVALAVSLVPAISEAMARNDLASVRQRCRTAIRVTIISSLPWATVYFLMHQQISSLVFGLPAAGLPLQVLAFGCVFFYLLQTTGGILQGMGRVDMALRHVVLGAMINLVLVYWLTASSYGTRGTAAANGIGWAFSALLNLWGITRLTGMRLDLRRWVVIPLVASTGMGLTLIFVWLYIRLVTGQSSTATLAALATSLPVYIILLFIGGGISWHDLRHVPFFRRWLR